MGEWIIEFLEEAFTNYGYWVIFFGVMLENAGLLVPGETVLLYAGYLCFHGRLDLTRVMIVSSLGASLGDNLGYLLGRRFGFPLLNRYRKGFLGKFLRYDRAQQLFLRHSNWAVFTGRFITGLRVFAGPFAGIFRMRYRRFLFFDTLGAVLWGISITLIGYAIGDWRRIVEFIARFNRLLWGVVALVVTVLVLRARRRKREQAREQGKEAPLPKTTSN
ncbi:MAG: DedA family protein [Acidobacteria bacterium]|nr:DedA family protein [Acidobacteriota bacterium]